MGDLNIGVNLDGVLLDEDHLRYLLEEAWDAGYEAAEWAEKLRRWRQPVTTENPYRKEDRGL